MIKNFWVLGFVVALSVSAWTASATENSLQIDRYTELSLKPARDVTNPLDVVINVMLPKQMRFVGDAFEFLLTRSGYQIKEPSSVDGGEMYILFSLPIPSQHREMGMLRLETALKVLASEAYQMHVNSVTRQIWFSLKEDRKDELVGVDLEKYKNRWSNRFVSHHDMPSSITPLTTNASYGPILVGETLGKIAAQLDAPGITMSQRLMAIFNVNSHEFMDGNMNKLKTGGVIKIPSLNEMAAYDSREAEAFQVQQYDEFLNRSLPSDG